MYSSQSRMFWFSWGDVFVPRFLCRRVFLRSRRGIMFHVSCWPIQFLSRINQLCSCESRLLWTCGVDRVMSIVLSIGNILPWRCGELLIMCRGKFLWTGVRGMLSMPSGTVQFVSRIRIVSVSQWRMFWCGRCDKFMPRHMCGRIVFGTWISRVFIVSSGPVQLISWIDNVYFREPWLLGISWSHFKLPYLV